MNIQATLNQADFLINFKRIIKVLGLKAGVILCELISMSGDQKSNGQFFCATIQHFEEELGLSAHEQRMAINLLTEMKLIEFRLQGMPKVRYVKLYEENILALTFAKPETRSSEVKKINFPKVNLNNLTYIGVNISSPQIKKVNFAQAISQVNLKKLTYRGKNFTSPEIKNFSLSNIVNSNKITSKQDKQFFQNCYAKNSHTPLFEVKKKPSNKRDEIATMFGMIYSFTENEEVQQKLKEYLQFRLTRKLQINQWEIILTDLRNYAETDTDIAISMLNSAIAGGYMTIIPSWEKNKKQQGYQRKFDTMQNVKSQSYINPEDMKKDLAKDTSGEIILF